MSNMLSPAGGTVRASPAPLDSRGAPGAEALPHAEAAIAAAHKPARMAPRMTRVGEAASHRADATRPRKVREARMEKKPQDTGNREQDTGHRTQEEHQLRRGSDIARGLLDVGAHVVELMRQLPDDAAGRHLAIQLFRCATSPGASYEEARAAESKADFVHKVSIAAKEMRESCYWIALLDRSGWVKKDLGPLVREAQRLAAILGASARTARRRGPAGR